MVTLTIDGKQISVENNATIYDAAKSAGIRIPVICHDKKLHPFGGCRMCLVEVEQMRGRLIPACTTPVSEGMIVRTSNDDIVNARKLVLELLLLKHPLDCPVCDAAGDCELQNLTFEYGVNANRFTDEKFNEEIDYNNPLIERDMNRCVHCGKCARICDEIVSFGALSFVNRGIEAQIGTPYSEALHCEFCGSCISVCPVGALNSRPFKYKSRPWAMKKVETVCSYCGTGCQLTYGVKDNKVLTTIYNEDQGFHNGQLCCRGRFGYQYINSSERLTSPLVRKNGTLVPASWEEAYTLIADKFGAAKGKGGVLFTPRLTNEELLALKKFSAVFAPEAIDHSAGYAHEALSKGMKASFGVPSSPSSFSDIQKADLLLLISSDLYETHPVVGFEINLAVKRKEAALRIISDKHGKIGKLPDAKTLIHKPGLELAMVNALAAVIVSEGLVADSAKGVEGYDSLVAYLKGLDVAALTAEAGVTADEITSLAKEYAAAEKALVMMSAGLGYPSHNAALASAVANIAILTGKIGKEGSGILVLGEKSNSQGAADLEVSTAATGKNGIEILKAAKAGEIKALYIAGENPVVSYPDRNSVVSALDSCDFVVVQDLFLTETAAMADVVLPALSAAEKEGTFTSAGRHVQRLFKAVSPIAGCRTDLQIFTEIGKKIGIEIPAQLELSDEISATVPGYSAVKYSTLGTAGVHTSPEYKSVLTVNPHTAVKADGGKFILITGNALHHCGTMSLHGQGPLAVSPSTYLEIGREDATELKINNGDAVKVTSPKGELVIPAKVTLRLSKGTVFIPYHFAENSLNTLTSADSSTSVNIVKQ